MSVLYNQPLPQQRTAAGRFIIAWVRCRMMRRNGSPRIVGRFFTSVVVVQRAGAVHRAAVGRFCTSMAVVPYAETQHRTAVARFCMGMDAVHRITCKMPHHLGQTSKLICLGDEENADADREMRLSMKSCRRDLSRGTNLVPRPPLRLDKISSGMHLKGRLIY